MENRIYNIIYGYFSIEDTYPYLSKTSVVRYDDNVMVYYNKGILSGRTHDVVLITKKEAESNGLTLKEVESICKDALKRVKNDPPLVSRR